MTNSGWLDPAGGGHLSIYILSPLFSLLPPQVMASVLLFMLCLHPAPHYPGPDFTFSPRCQGRGLVRGERMAEHHRSA